ncbi:MAG TPA: HupE/UreJ family protein [Polyangia bacterium]|nr:HupE/UreJ family protein [Polyangia bacterium]
MSRATTCGPCLTRGTLVVAVIGFLQAPHLADAHQQSATFGEISRAAPAGEAEVIGWRLRVRVSDLAFALRPRPGSGRWSRDDAESYLRAGLHVRVGDEDCSPAGSSLGPDPAGSEPTLIFVQRFRCPRHDGSLRLRYDLFFESDRFHQSFTRLALAAATSTVVFREGFRQIVLGPGEEPSSWRAAAIYLRLGIIHILTGYDHLSFLMALLLGAALSRRTTARSEAAAASMKQALGKTVKVISAFTVAHSLTLILQALRPGWISTRWVEPAIAFSVATVGFQNLVPRPPQHRWLLVFGFGLIHGLGFASVLQEIGLPRRGLVLSLLSFNLGVELGQLLVLAVTFPVIEAAARRAPRRFERWGLQLGSGLIGAFGTVWLVARLAAH